MIDHDLVDCAADLSEQVSHDFAHHTTRTVLLALISLTAITLERLPTPHHDDVTTVIRLLRQLGAELIHLSATRH